MNFIDARTKWFDGAVTEALADGIKQVGARGGGCVGVGCCATRLVELARYAVRVVKARLDDAEVPKETVAAQDGCWGSYQGCMYGTCT